MFSFFNFFKGVLRGGKPYISDKTDNLLPTEDIPRYPPFVKGLPVVPINSIVLSQSELLNRIEMECGSKLFNEIYLPAIKNYATFVHLLPASENHHHRGAGGLFRHGLEVGFNALLFSKGKLFDVGIPAIDREKNESKWHLAAFLSGLTHDLGKPLSDYRVMTPDGKESWNPFSQNLLEWAQQNSAEKYFLHWMSSRYRKHESLSSVVAERIIPQAAFSFLSTPGNNIIRNMFECITNQPSFENKLFELVGKADHHSTEKDIKNTPPGVESGNSIPLDKYITDTVKFLNIKNEWGDEFNDHPPLLMINSSLFISNAAMKRICAELEKKKIPGIPWDSEILVETLIGAGFARPRDLDTGDTVPLWELRKKGESKPFSAVKIKDWSIIYPYKPSETPGYTLFVSPVKVEQVGSETQEVSPVKVEQVGSETQEVSPVKVEQVGSETQEVSPVKVVKGAQRENGNGLEKKTVKQKSLRTPESDLLFLDKKIQNSFVSISGRTFIDINKLPSNLKDRELLKKISDIGFIEKNNGNLAHIINTIPMLLLSQKAMTVYGIKVDDTKKQENDATEKDGENKSVPTSFNKDDAIKADKTLKNNPSTENLDNGDQNNRGKGLVDQAKETIAKVGSNEAIWQKTNCNMPIDLIGSNKDSVNEVLMTLHGEGLVREFRGSYIKKMNGIDVFTLTKKGVKAFSISGDSDDKPGEGTSRRKPMTVSHREVPADFDPLA
jgi:hypothetical protein